MASKFSVLKNIFVYSAETERDRNINLSNIPLSDSYAKNSHRLPLHISCLSKGMNRLFYPVSLLSSQTTAMAAASPLDPSSRFYWGYCQVVLQPPPKANAVVCFIRIYNGVRGTLLSSSSAVLLAYGYDDASAL